MSHSCVDRAIGTPCAIAASDRLADLGGGRESRMVDDVMRRSGEPAALMDAPRVLWLHIGANELVVSSGAGATAQTEHRLDLGASRIACEFFHHEPPTAREIEHAIDAIEDQIMRLGTQGDAGLPLHSSSERLQPWATVSGPTIAIETVEQWFDRLALAAQGRPGALDGLPCGREAAATLLVLREVMHHRGHPSIRVVEPAAVQMRLARRETAAAAQPSGRRRMLTATSVTTVSGTTKLIITPENAVSASCCWAARIR